MNELLDLEFKRMVCIALRDNYSLWQISLNKNTNNDFKNSMDMLMNIFDNLANKYENEYVKAENRILTIEQMLNVKKDNDGENDEI